MLGASGDRAELTAIAARETMSFVGVQKGLTMGGLGVAGVAWYFGELRAGQRCRNSELSEPIPGRVRAIPEDRQYVCIRFGFLDVGRKGERCRVCALSTNR